MKIYAYDYGKQVIATKEVNIYIEKSDSNISYFDNRLNESIQVVDGFWTIDCSKIKIHPQFIGYDRTFALGDTSWTDYEITFSVIVNQVDKNAFNTPISINPGFGVFLRWLGHSDSPIKNKQPHSGWEPHGGSCWYEFMANQPDKLKLQIPTFNPKSIENANLQISLNKEYKVNLGVISNLSGFYYYYKIWKQDNEAAVVCLERIVDSKTNLSQGAILFVAHHVELTISNLQVVSLKKKGMKRYLSILFPYLINSPLFFVFSLGIYQINTLGYQEKNVITVALTTLIIIYIIQIQVNNYLANFLFKKGKGITSTNLIVQSANFIIKIAEAFIWFAILRSFLNSL